MCPFSSFETISRCRHRLHVYVRDRFKFCLMILDRLLRLVFDWVQKKVEQICEKSDEKVISFQRIIRLTTLQYWRIWNSVLVMIGRYYEKIQGEWIRSQYVNQRLDRFDALKLYLDHQYLWNRRIWFCVTIRKMINCLDDVVTLPISWGINDDNAMETLCDLSRYSWWSWYPTRKYGGRDPMHQGIRLIWRLLLEQNSSKRIKTSLKDGWSRGYTDEAKIFWIKQVAYWALKFGKKKIEEHM